AGDGGGLGVVVVLVLANLKLLGTGVAGDPGSGYRCAGGKGARGLLFVGSSGGRIHFRVFELAGKVFDGEVVGAERLGFDDLPGVFIAAKGDVLLLGDELNLGEFVEVRGEEALVAQIGGRFIQASFGVAADGEESRVAGDHHKRVAAR